MMTASIALSIARMGGFPGAYRARILARGGLR